MRRHSTKLLIVLVVLAVPFVYGLAQYTADQSTAFLPSIVKSAQVTDMFDGYLYDCQTVHWGVQVVFLLMGSNGIPLNLSELPGGPYSFVYSDAPDGIILGQITQSGAILTMSEQVMEDDWHVWVVNGNNQRASTILSLHSDSELGMGNCQHFHVDFFSPSIPGPTPPPPPPPYPTNTAAP